MSDRYEIKGRLGRGGIGAVYTGYDTQLDREVAIKRLLPLEETQLNEADTGSLSREAAALAKFQHPNVVTIFGFEEDEDGPFVITELINGENLKTIVEKGALSVRDFQEFVSQSLDALIAAEQMNLMHRDIKPANIMLLFLPSGKFQVKILDFGLAKFSLTPSAQTLDYKGSFLGSIDYIAPEQIERRPLDQRTDLYSLGCVCYFMLTQQPPFEGKNLAVTMQNHLDHKVAPLAGIRPDLPPAIGDWIMRMIALDPAHRPANASEAVEEFEESKLGVSPELPGGNGSTGAVKGRGEIEVTPAPTIWPRTSPQAPASDTTTQRTATRRRQMITGTQKVSSVSESTSSDTTTTQPTAKIQRQAITRPQAVSAVPQTGAKPQSPKKQNMTGAYVALGGAAVLLIGGLIHLFGGGGDKKTADADMTPPRKRVVLTPPPKTPKTESKPATSAGEALKPVEVSKITAPTGPAAFGLLKKLESPENPSATNHGVPLPPYAENLSAYYSAQNWVFGEGYATPAREGDSVYSWGNLTPGAGKKHLLGRKTGAANPLPTVEIVVPSESPELKAATPVLRFTPEKFLVTPHIKNAVSGLKGEQITVMTLARTGADAEGNCLMIFNGLNKENPDRALAGALNLISSAKRFGATMRIVDKRPSVSQVRNPDQFTISTTTWNGSDGGFAFYVRNSDGTRLESPLRLTGYNGEIQFTSYKVGREIKTKGFTGDMIELLIFDRVLTKAQIIETENWLAGRYFKK